MARRPVFSGAAWLSELGGVVLLPAPMRLLAALALLALAGCDAILPPPRFENRVAVNGRILDAVTGEPVSLGPAVAVLQGREPFDFLGGALTLGRDTSDVGGSFAVEAVVSSSYSYSVAAWSEGQLPFNDVPDHLRDAYVAQDRLGVRQNLTIRLWPTGILDVAPDLGGRALREGELLEVYTRPTGAPLETAALLLNVYPGEGATPKPALLEGERDLVLSWQLNRDGQRVASGEMPVRTVRHGRVAVAIALPAG